VCSGQSYRKPLWDTRGQPLNVGTFVGLPKRMDKAPLRIARWPSLLAGLLGVFTLWGQPTDSTVTGPVHVRGRLLGTVIGGGVVIGGTLIALDRTWYSQYDRAPFHGFNDGAEWLQLDKMGHAFATYTVGQWGCGLMRWSGVPERTALWVGGTLGLTYLTAVEYLDGRSAEWGFSGWDMVANVGGTGLFIGQELAWKEQRIRLKYSTHLTDSARLRPSVLGEGLSERILKDYNGNAYWLSANLRAFGVKGAPVWLSMAVGYGGEGLLYATGTPGEYRQFYLSPDIDLARIPTKSKFLRTALAALNCVKVPMPALEFSQGGLRGHWLYF
jgi:Predicted periplasmic lipoprotein (DUF2279)